MIFQVSNAFKIKTPQGIVGLEPGAVVDFPPDKAEPLVNAGKIIPFRKGGPLPEKAPAKPFVDTFKEAMNDLEERYLPGALDFIREDFPDLAQEIQEAEKRINFLKVNLRLCRGLPEFDNSGNKESLPTVNRSKFTEKEAFMEHTRV